MADIKGIKLPDNNTYNFRDSRVSSLTVENVSTPSGQTKSIASGSTQEFTLNVAKTGKKAIAIAGMDSGYPATVSIRWFKLNYSAQTVTCRLWNHHSAALTTGPIATLLYISDS